MLKLKQLYKNIMGLSGAGNETQTLKLLIAKGLIQNQEPVTDIHGAEFKVFSQWGDDGIIQYFINHIEIKNKIFIEFGVENYTEANTRFLLMNNNRQGLVMDGNQANIDSLADRPYCDV